MLDAFLVCPDCNGCFLTGWTTKKGFARQIEELKGVLG